MAGFGGTSAKGKKIGKQVGKVKNIKLKSNTQWDRYVDVLTESTSYPVAVRTVTSDGVASDWYEVGRVRSGGDVTTAVAVAVQRGLIVEHAKRLVPGRVRPKDRVEWGYGDGEGGRSFSVVEGSVIDGASEGVEGLVGFEGLADPSSGFYCVSGEGRMLGKMDATRRRAIDSAPLAPSSTYPT